MLVVRLIETGLAVIVVADEYVGAFGVGAEIVYFVTFWA